mgnify:CR=1 FL=1
MISFARRVVFWVVSLGFLPLRWRAACAATLGAAAGAGMFVFHISRASSYLSHAPETCANCHVMWTQYLTWQHSSHARSATCNDCHVPHTSPWARWAFKARDGLWHATVFTMHWEPQVIRLSGGAVPVIEANCRRCHDHTIQMVGAARHASGDLRCWECHREVPHGRVRGLSTVPDVFPPRLPSLQSPDQQPQIGGRPVRPASGVLP